MEGTAARAPLLKFRKIFCPYTVFETAEIPDPEAQRACGSLGSPWKTAREIRNVLPDLAAVSCRNAFRKRADGLGKPRAGAARTRRVANRGERSSGPQHCSHGRNRQRIKPGEKRICDWRGGKVSRGGAGIWRLPLDGERGGVRCVDRFARSSQRSAGACCRGARDGACKHES